MSAARNLLEPSPIASDCGQLIGRDPRELKPAELEAADVPLMLAADAIRAKCVDCCAGDTSEVRKCVSISCPLWLFRMRGRLPSPLKAAALVKIGNGDLRKFPSAVFRGHPTGGLEPDAEGPAFAEGEEAEP